MRALSASVIERCDCVCDDSLPEPDDEGLCSSNWPDGGNGGSGGDAAEVALAGVNDGSSEAA